MFHTVFRKFVVVVLVVAGTGLGSAGMAAAAEAPPSADEQAAIERLERLKERLNEAFDQLRRLINEYNTTARGIIDEIAR